MIRPDLDKRDQLKTTWLSSKSTADKERYLKQKSTVQRLISVEEYWTTPTGQWRIKTISPKDNKG